MIRCRGRIFGGEAANLKTELKPVLKLVVAFTDLEEMDCGGTLIPDPKFRNGSRFVLTATHCFIPSSVYAQ